MKCIAVVQKKHFPKQEIVSSIELLKTEKFVIAGCLSLPAEIVFKADLVIDSSNGNILKDRQTKITKEMKEVLDNYLISLTKNLRK